MLNELTLDGLMLNDGVSGESMLDGPSMFWRKVGGSSIGWCCPSLPFLMLNELFWAGRCCSGDSAMGWCWKSWCLMGWCWKIGFWVGRCWAGLPWVERVGFERVDVGWVDVERVCLWWVDVGRAFHGLNEWVLNELMSDGWMLNECVFGGSMLYGPCIFWC